jgi:hypothetical protein
MANKYCSAAALCYPHFHCGYFCQGAALTFFLPLVASEPFRSYRTFDGFSTAFEVSGKPLNKLTGDNRHYASSFVR